MKKRLLQTICVILAAACLTGMCAAEGDQPAAERNAILSQFPFVEVSVNASNLYTLPSGFVYNDGLFFLDNDTLSPELAKISAGLASAAYTWDYLKDALSAMKGPGNAPGFDFADYREDAVQRKGNWNRSHTATDNDFVRYVIAAKSGVVYDGEEYIIYCVPIQGTSGSFDWESDFNIGSGDNHAGFYLARSEIMQDLYDRLQSDGYDAGHTIVWTMGHSRGASVSNIVAGELTAGGGAALGLDFSGLVTPERVYSYNFACPAVSKSTAVTSTHFGNIFNFNNPDDVIPTLPLADWGYDRYGVTLHSMSTKDRGNLEQQYRRMISNDYAGTADAPTCMETIVKELIPNGDAANSVAAQALFHAIAYALHNEKSLPGLFEAAGVFLTEHTWQMIMDTYLKPLEYLENLIAVVGMLPGYISETEEMSSQEFSQWLVLNRVGVEAIENAVGINIASREDLLTAKTISDMDLNPYTSLLADEKVTFRKLTTALTSLADYMWGGNSVLGMLTAITHGHANETYVLWINSMYFGYEGWIGYRVEGEKIALTPDVPCIGVRCFSGSSGIGTLSMTENVIYLGSFICKDAVGLENLSLNGSFSELPSSAFYGCTGLTSVIIPAHITGIGSDAFANCANLADVSIPEGVTAIGGGAFNGCTSLTSIRIPNTVTAIGNYAFQNSGLTEMSLPASLPIRVVWGTYLSYLNDAFQGCTGITTVCLTGSGEMAQYTMSMTPWGQTEQPVSVVIEEGVTSISAEAFKGCANLVSVTIPDTVSVIGKEAFCDCTGLTEVVLPDGLESVGQSVFSGCTGLRSADGMLEKLTAVTVNMFSGCTGLTSLHIPACVTSISDGAFRGCSGLTEVELPAGISMGDAFAYCTEITSVRLTGTGEMARFIMSQAPWGRTARQVSVEIEEGVTGISESAFDGCANLVSISIPASVTGIGECAFRGCSGLTEVELPDGLETIGPAVFSGCTGFLSVDAMLEKMPELPSSAFYGCTGLTSVIIPAHINGIGSDAFANCANLADVSIPEGVTAIGGGAFNGCTSLTSIRIPNTVTAIGSYAFQDSGLTEMSLPVSLPIRVVWGTYLSYLNDAFQGCTGITTVCLTGSGEMAQYTMSMTPWGQTEQPVSVVIEEGVTSISAEAFKGCANLVSVTIPDTVSVIGKEAFCDCTGLTDIYYSGAEAQWDSITVGSGNELPDTATIHYLSGHVHAYSDPAWSWAADFSSASAAFVCGVCGEALAVPAGITVSEIPPAALEDGLRTYTAAVTFGGETYTDERTETLYFQVEADTAAIRSAENLSISGLSACRAVIDCGAEANAVAYAARYDALGRLLGVESMVLQPGDNEFTVLRGSADVVRFYVLDSITWAPLCEAAEAPEPNPQG